MKINMAALIDQAARLAGQRVAGARLGDIDKLIDQMDEGADVTAMFAAAWRAADLDGTPVRLNNPSPVNLPFVAYSNGLGWVMMQSFGADGFWHGMSIYVQNQTPAKIQPEAETITPPSFDELLTAPAEDAEIISESTTTEPENIDVPPENKSQRPEILLEKLDGITCILLPQRSGVAQARPSAMSLVRSALWARKGVFVDAVLATMLINLLTLATSLYSMQVFDRVIPSEGFQTLWVLTIGVSLSICLEFMLKHVRSRTVDHTCNGVDHKLSEWFFNRMLGIRMEARPASVGTLASQIKGFEMVRGVLASTSLFVIADVPFAIFFLFVIFLIGGWVVAVPIVAMPIALVAGVMFQRAIQHHTRLNLSASNRKAGLLVEAVDGAESLKTNSAEWIVQARWNRLVQETSHAEQSIRNYSALSQNLTVGFQQLSYIALVAVGAYFVTQNEMTMGALLACSIIGNRAMMPIVQLPGVMVQWALARAAIEGLEQIINLPNEADEAHHALTPQTLDGSFRFERTRFSYGMGPQGRVVLEIEHLNIKPGERVGLIGPIGSGKSTFLKLASGLYRPAAGKVFLGGVDLALLSSPVMREIIGYLPQEAKLFSGTLRDNLTIGLPDPGEEAILAASRRTGLIDLILGQPKGLALELTEGGRGVSGGQKQLIAVT
ncbi:MAG: ATP-binding cassette domain-containing protein, partial [Candidatus Nitrotoga sp.]